MVLQGFGSGECEYFAAVADAFYADSFVHHGFGYMRVASGGFGGGAHHGPHIGLVLIGLHFALCIDHGGSPDGSSRVHVDAVAGDGNQCPGRSGVDVDIDHGRGRAFQKHGPDFVGFFECSAKGVQFQKDVVGFLLAGFVQGFFREPGGGRADFIVYGKAVKG